MTRTINSSRFPSATAWLWLAVASLAASACVSEGPSMDLQYFGNGDGTPGDSTGTSGSATSGGAGSAAPNPDGIPCEVLDLLDANCNACHASGATAAPALDSYASLTAPSASDPSRSVAALSLDTMNGTGMQMPPSGSLSAADIAPFADWVAAGTPAGTCGGGGGAGGGGPNPYNTPPICTTGNFWNQGNEGSHRMHPGVACNDCHDNLNKGPIYDIAGTVYPTAHEPDDCNGTNSSLSGASVVVLDANGQQFSASIQSGGNFSLNTTIAFPVTVKVVNNGNEIAMVAPVQANDGDCNVCHTQNGDNGAPGRILIP